MPDGHIASRPYALLVRAMRETKKHAFAGAEGHGS
jgi:hypothetical protein